MWGIHWIESSTFPLLTASKAAAPTTKPLNTSSDPPEVKVSSVPGLTTPKQKKKTLFVGDSISGNVDIGALENATQSKFVTARAYSSVYDTVTNVAKQAAKFPKSNFTDVVPKQLEKDDYQTLVLQAGSVDVTNLNTKENPSESSCSVCNPDEGEGKEDKQKNKVDKLRASCASMWYSPLGASMRGQLNISKMQRLTRRRLV